MDTKDQSQKFGLITRVICFFLPRKTSHQMYGTQSMENDLEHLMVIMVLYGQSIVIVCERIRMLNCLSFINLIFFKGDSTKVATGSADSTLRLWDCETGKCLNTLKTTTSVRTVLFSYSGNLILYSTDQVLKMQPEINVIDTRTRQELSEIDSLITINSTEHTKVLSSLWGSLDESFITGHESGKIIQWDMRNPGEIITEMHPHKNQINDLQYNKEQTMFISASKDKTAKVSFL